MNVVIKRKCYGEENTTTKLIFSAYGGTTKFNLNLLLRSVKRKILHVNSAPNFILGRF